MRDRPNRGRPGRSIPWAAVSAAVMAIAVVVAVVTYQPGADIATELGSRIRCPVCEGVPIASSPAPMARDMMVLLRERLEAGASHQEAVDAVIGAYPGSLYLDASPRATTAALWLVPTVAIVAGIGLALTVRRSQAGIDSGAERRELEQRLSHVRADLDDLQTQTAAGDIDPEMAVHLREAYEAELAETKEALAAVASEDDPPRPRSPRRVAVGAALVVGSLAVIVAVAGAFITDRPDVTAGVAGAVPDDPAEYSNETLAAVIAANVDHPQIDGMRLALAERYFRAGDYQSAFGHYLDVAQSELAAPDQAATALTRLGWMAYDGNDEVDTALALLAEARAIAPADPFPLYLEGIVRWCGDADPSAGAAAFQEVLDSAELDAAIESQVRADLAAAQAGQECT